MWKNTEFLSFMSDGSTDSSVKEGELVYVRFHTSTLNRANLGNSFQALGCTPLVPTRIGGTQWVGHLLRDLDHFLQGYQGLVQHLDQVMTLDCYAKYSKSHHLYEMSSK